MKIGVRFSSPVLDDENIKLLSSSFNNKTKELKKILNNAPYEMSIIACLIKKLEEKLTIYNLWI